ncbi:SusC/RagA family TonB-linked outer membrane protein [Salegentibacter salegens]|uniref:TonB-linked outer membrane protein, SusC/RagA family n=1 Tax=Salegentibacter salegens TaxID=143223 RepID=A0A1M7KTP7_9FLAO|nr:TonB-dependent receptor [Salegentibacter salegens]PRX43802.1 TonB-linked SusC/RagA family outer membrane protein [Salegentibacter salegens]SHM68879.1 TonB-linked outer membrane protein, SusC/RagA family [Salegentibacter salegens]
MKKKLNGPLPICTTDDFSKKLIRIMKIYSLILCLTIVKISASSLTVYGQNIELNYQDTELRAILYDLEEQTDYNFFYNNKLVNEKVRINISFSSENVQEVMFQILKSTNINFKIINNNIVLYKDDFSEASEYISNHPSGRRLTSQGIIDTYDFQQVVEGKVMDDNGLPLPGVNVIIQNTNTGTQTDFDGVFSIEAEEGDVLEFSYLGMESLTYRITDLESPIEVVMLQDADQLSEVLVVAYGKQSRASFTGAAVDVDVSKIDESPLASFQESLQGNVAGLQMSAQSGQPGAAPDIRIRGIGSINASSDPLYVVDGIPVVSGNISQIATSSNTIAGINPKDIENITVLKDASATSIYGSRGANGVILITTKQGKEGKTTFEVGVQRGISQMLLPDRNKPLNTAQHLELLIESRVNAGDTQQEAEDFIYGNVDRNIDTDWEDVITRNGSYEQYNISASGGSEKTQFFASLGLYEQEGVIIGIGYNKLNARLNVNHQATDKLKIDFGIAANNQKLNTNSDGGSAHNPVRALARVVPWEPVYNEDGSYNTDILLTYNPVGLVEQNVRETKIYGILGNLSLTYDFTENFSFQTKGNVDFNLADEFRFDNPVFGEGRNDGGRGRAYNNKIINYNITNLLKYNWRINEDHNLDFTLGQEAQKIERSSVYAFVSNYGAPGLTTLENASVYRNATNSRTASSISSYFINASYAFGNKYYLNATARRDGSSRFGSDVRYANFGSVGAAWNIAAEDFMEDAEMVKELKLRSSYGVNGNQEIGNFASRGLYSTGADYNGEPGYVYSQQSNPSLTWEKNKPFNVGFDFNFNHRITGTVEYYNRTTTDLLFRVPISATNGITNFLTNIGEMKNSGWEFALNTVNIDNPDGLNWITNFNFTTNANEITKLQDDESIVDGYFIREIGEDFYTFYMPGFAGADPENGDALWYTDESETTTTNQYSEAQPYKQGSGLPDFYSGLTNTLTYKNLSFSFMLYLNYGNKVYDYWGRYTNSDGSARLNDRGNMTQNIYENRWQNPGDITDVPKVVWGNSQSGLSSQHSTRFLYDGTYLRLRDVTLSYDLPESFIERIRVNNLRLYLKGNNLLTWVKDDKIELDPEVGITGQSDLRIPISRQLLVGLDLSF